MPTNEASIKTQKDRVCRWRFREGRVSREGMELSAPSHVPCSIPPFICILCNSLYHKLVNKSGSLCSVSWFSRLIEPKEGVVRTLAHMKQPAAIDGHLKGRGSLGDWAPNLWNLILSPVSVAVELNSRTPRWCLLQNWLLSLWGKRLVTEVFCVGWVGE